MGGTALATPSVNVLTACAGTTSEVIISYDGG